MLLTLVKTLSWAKKLLHNAISYYLNVWLQINHNLSWKLRKHVILRETNYVTSNLMLSNINTRKWFYFWLFQDSVCQVVTPKNCRRRYQCEIWLHVALGGSRGRNGECKIYGRLQGLVSSLKSLATASQQCHSSRSQRKVDEVEDTEPPPAGPAPSCLPAALATRHSAPLQATPRPTTTVTHSHCRIA